MEAALPTDDARQRKRHSKFGIVDSDRNYGAFVTQHDFGDPRANHSNSVLAGSNPLDYRYIRVAHLLLDSRAEVVVVRKAALSKRIQDRDTAYADTRPLKDLGCSVFTENLRFDTRGRYLEFSPQMHPEAQTVEQCACAENAIMPGELAGQIGKRIRRVRYDKQHGIPRRLAYLRNNLAIDLGILVQEP